MNFEQAVVSVVGPVHVQVVLHALVERRLGFAAVGQLERQKTRTLKNSNLVERFIYKITGPQQKHKILFLFRSGVVLVGQFVLNNVMPWKVK